jgi:1-deoxy-D-xylulose-5-phosphate synthase
LGLPNPMAIRYPRGRGYNTNWQVPYAKIEIGKAICLKDGEKVAVLTTGTIGYNITQAFEKLKNSDAFAHYDFGFVKPLDEVALHYIFQKFKRVITLEEGCISGGFGSAINEFAQRHRYLVPIQNLGVPDVFIEHGTVDELQQICKIDSESLTILLNELQ